MEQSCKFSVGFKNMHAASLSHATALIGLSYREHENEKRQTPNERRGMHDSEPRYQGIPLEKLRIDRQASRHCMRLLESISFWGNFSLKTKNIKNIMHKHEGKKGGRGGWKQHGNGSTRIQMLSSLTWNFDGIEIILIISHHHHQRIWWKRNTAYY